MKTLTHADISMLHFEWNVFDDMRTGRKAMIFLFGSTFTIHQHYGDDGFIGLTHNYESHYGSPGLTVGAALAMSKAFDDAVLIMERWQQGVME